MENAIALTASQRRQIFTLNDINRLSDRTQERLTSGRTVSNVKDDPFIYFKSLGLFDRAESFAERKDSIDQAISSLTVATETSDSIEDLLLQMKGIIESTRSQTLAERTSATEQFLEVGDQISKLVDDAYYNGVNLLTKVRTNLDVYFSERTTSRLQVEGFDFNTTVAGSQRSLFSTAAFQPTGDTAAFSVFAGAAAEVTFKNGDMLKTSGFSQIGELNSAISLVEQMGVFIDDAISRVRAAAFELGNNVAVLQVRLDFTDEYSDNLAGGGDKLTLADINQEGANMVALETRYQLGMESLSFSGDMHRQIVTLIQ